MKFYLKTEDIGYWVDLSITTLTVISNFQKHGFGGSYFNQ